MQNAVVRVSDARAGKDGRYDVVLVALVALMSYHVGTQPIEIRRTLRLDGVDDFIVGAGGPHRASGSSGRSELIG